MTDNLSGNVEVENFGLDKKSKIDTRLADIISDEELNRFITTPVWHWKRSDVLAWALANVRKYKHFGISPVDIPLFQLAKLEGREVAALTQADFLQMSPKLGKQLYSDLQELLEIERNDQVLKELGLIEGGEQTESPEEIENSHISPDTEMVGDEERTEVIEKWEGEGEEEEAESEVEKPFESPPAKRKNRKNKRKLVLWKFIIEVLANPDLNPSVVRWEMPTEGIFKISDTKRLSSEWDSKKERRKNMTYEKLSRALRGYYKTSVLQPGPKDGSTAKKLVYKFGKRSVGWKEAAEIYMKNPDRFGYCTDDIKALLEVNND